MWEGFKTDRIGLTCADAPGLSLSARGATRGTRRVIFAAAFDRMLPEGVSYKDKTEVEASVIVEAFHLDTFLEQED